jgi:hypothetical protein
MSNYDLTDYQPKLPQQFKLWHPEPTWVILSHIAQNQSNSAECCINSVYAKFQHYNQEYDTVLGDLLQYGLVTFDFSPTADAYYKDHPTENPTFTKAP